MKLIPYMQVGSSFIFAFSPNRIKDIYHAILTANFTYPVYVDKQDSIAKLNRFPLESKPPHIFIG